MKKSLLTLLAFLAIYIAGFTQALTGTKTIGVEYPTVAAAIADLNFNGAGTGGVLFPCVFVQANNLHRGF